MKKVLFIFSLSVLYYLCFFNTALIAATVSGNVRRGNTLYVEGKYEDAAEKYQQALKIESESDIINFNAGAAYYQSDDFERAREHFQKALLSSDDSMRQRAYYNLGNTFYRKAESAGPQSPQGAVPLLERSLDHYEQALDLVPDDEDARFNYEFVKQVLEKVKEQVEKQKQQCDGSDQNQEQRQKGKEETQQGEQESQQGEQERLGTQEEDPSGGQDENEDQRGRGEDEKQQHGEQEHESSGAQSEQDLSQREAQRRLMEYQRNEEPQGLLNLRGVFDTRPVEKDW